MFVSLADYSRDRFHCFTGWNKPGANGLGVSLQLGENIDVTLLLVDLIKTARLSREPFVLKFHHGHREENRADAVASCRCRWGKVDLRCSGDCLVVVILAVRGVGLEGL